VSRPAFNGFDRAVFLAGAKVLLRVVLPLNLIGFETKSNYKIKFEKGLFEGWFLNLGIGLRTKSRLQEQM
jgi:hypothetical protein